MLYKYLAPQALSIESILSRMEVYFSRPKELNDPFELKPNIVYPSNTALKKYLRSRGVQHRNLKELLAANMENYRRNEYVFKSMITRGADDTGFFCLTPHFNNLLMWSHYADCHRGICIGFEIDQADDFDVVDSVFGVALPVEYSDYYPELSMLDLVHWNEISYDFIKPKEYDLVANIFKKMMFTKARIWEYEDEVRCYNVSSKKQAGFFSFPSRKLKEVIIGANASSETKEKVLNYTRENFPHTTIKQASISTKQYKLVFTST